MTRAPLRVGSELREVRDLHVVPAEGVEQHLGVLLRPQVRHQRREELRRHPGVESHLAGLVIGILKDFQCNDSLTGAVSIME